MSCSIGIINYYFTFISVNRQSCLVNIPSSADKMNNKLKEEKKTELDAIVTENSDSYFINY